MRTFDEIMADVKEFDTTRCPCKRREVIDMTDDERLQGHVSYWGEDEPTEMECPHCQREIYLKEHVSRHWSTGRTPDEAGRP